MCCAVYLSSITPTIQRNHCHRNTSASGQVKSCSIAYTALATGDTFRRMHWALLNAGASYSGSHKVCKRLVALTR